MTNQLFKTQDLPQFHQLDIAHFIDNLDAQLGSNRALINDLLSRKSSHTWESLMQPLEDMSDSLNKLWSPIAHLHAVMETDQLRTVYNEGLQLITEYHTELTQHEGLYHAIQAFADSDAAKALTPAQQKIIENDLRDFKLAGIHLPTEQKAKLAVLQLEHSKLMTLFSENILDATHAFQLAITDRAELSGLPEQTIQLAKETAEKKGIDGFVLTLDYPSYSSVMKFAHNRELRKSLHDAHITRASDQGPNAGRWDNTTVMNDILRVRHDIAKLVGFTDYAHLSLATKMAKTPNDVLSFLNDLLERSLPIAKQEMKELETLANKDGISRLEAWDVSYYSEKLKHSKYHFTQEDVRPYFPIDVVLSGLFQLVQRLYGITIEEQKDIDVWHNDVRFFKILDPNKQLCAGFYIDLYTRPHKRDGAWMDDCLSRCRLPDGTIQHPVAYLTCNFMPAVTHKPALLTHDDVLTLFHEFGHCLHHMLTQVDYPSVSGINGVPWDAVEFPSQFMENFCWEKASLDMIAKHHDTNAPLPDALYEKMIAAKYFQTGLHMIRQLEFALFDFKLHLNYDSEKANYVQATLDEVRANACVVPVSPQNRFQHSFSHIFAGGYAAGYYSYKWAEVLSSDAYAAFEEKGLFDPSTGHAFLENILAVGGVNDPMQAFIAFRGRKPTIDALLKHSGMTKEPTA